MRKRYEPVYMLPAALALAGPLVAVAITGGGFLPFALPWWGLSLVVGSIGSRKVRIGLSLLVDPVMPLVRVRGRSAAAACNHLAALDRCRERPFSSFDEDPSARRVATEVIAFAWASVRNVTRSAAARAYS
jgi:hypothetical protein